MNATDAENALGILAFIVARRLEGFCPQAHEHGPGACERAALADIFGGLWHLAAMVGRDAERLDELERLLRETEVDVEVIYAAAAEALENRKGRGR